MVNDKAYRIIIADPSEIVTEGLTLILSRSPKFKVIGTSNTLNRLLEKIVIQKLDILILNPTLVDYSQRTMLHDIFPMDHPFALVALIGSFIERKVLKQFHGYIEIIDGQSHIESTLMEIVQTAQTSSGQSADNYCLSKREVDVLIAAAKGLQNKEIANELNISIHTVITHRKNIARKTGIKSVSGLTVYALLNNLIDEHDIQ